ADQKRQQRQAEAVVTPQPPVTAGHRDLVGQQPAAGHGAGQADEKQDQATIGTAGSTHRATPLVSDAPIIANHGAPGPLRRVPADGSAAAAEGSRTMRVRMSG